MFPEEKETKSHLEALNQFLTYMQLVSILSMYKYLFKISDKF